MALVVILATQFLHWSRIVELAARVSERAMLIDAASLEAYKWHEAAPGRPYSAKVAFGILWLLSGKEPSWLTYHQLRRCRLALDRLDAETLESACRKRSRTIRLRVPESYVPTASEHLVRSGVSAIDAYRFDLTENPAVLEGYAGEEAYRLLEGECFAVPDSAGNLIVHVADDAPNALEGMMPEAVVAIDLADSLETRTHEVGIERLRELLDARR